MTAPTSVKNTGNQSVDTLYRGDGSGRLKLAVGSTDAGLSAPLAWQGVATHAAGDALAASDGVVVTAGVDLADGETVRPIGVDAEGRAVVVTQPSSGGVTDRSGVVTVGGVPQTLAAVKLDRKYLLVQNLHASEDLWVNFTVDAVADKPSVRVAPGAAFIMDGAYVTSEKVTVIAATTGHKFTAKEA